MTTVTACEPRRGRNVERVHDAATWAAAWEHRWLVFVVARDCCRGTTANPRDYLIDGLRGLCRALVSFDPERSEWSKHASIHINQVVRRAIHRDLMPVRVPINAPARLRLHRERGASPQPGTPDADAAVFLDRPILRDDRGEDGFRLFEIPDHRHDEESRDHRIDAAEVIPRLLGCLDRRERALIVALYGINGQAKMLQTTLAKRRGVTKQAIQQAERRAIRKMAGMLGVTPTQPSTRPHCNRQERTSPC